MKVIVADAMGMCFGVRDALRRVGEVDRPAETTIDGQLVHNELLLQQLDQQGFRQTHEHSRDGVPETAQVLITAHGVSDHRRQWHRIFEAQSWRIGSRAHRQRRGLLAEGYEQQWERSGGRERL